MRLEALTSAIGQVLPPILVVCVAGAGGYFAYQKITDDETDHFEQEVIFIDVEAESLEEIEQANEDFEVPDPEVPGEDVERSIPELRADDHYLGPPDAKYSIVWYSSISNRLSALIYPEIISFLEEHEDVNLIFRHFPLSERKLDWSLSQISECIAQDIGNETFWEFLNSAFMIDKITISYGVEVAKELGLSDERVQECFSDDKTGAIHGRVMLDKRHAWAYGKITSSPALVFIDNDEESAWFIDRAVVRNFMDEVWAAMSGEGGEDSEEVVEESEDSAGSELCGNGDIDEGEECDDGGSCAVSECPDTAQCMPTALCESDEIPSLCGDNPCVPLSGDGCSADCQRESGSEEDDNETLPPDEDHPTKPPEEDDPDGEEIPKDEEEETGIEDQEEPEPEAEPPVEDQEDEEIEEEDDVVVDPVFQNVNNPLDVNADGEVTQEDATHVIAYVTYLNGGDLPPETGTPLFYDVNGDGVATVLDALIVIERLVAVANEEQEEEVPPEEEEVPEEEMDETPYYNDLIPRDTDGNGEVELLDALIVASFVSSEGDLVPVSQIGIAGPPYYDVNNDGVVTKLDAYLIIEKLIDDDTDAVPPSEAVLQNPDNPLDVDDNGVIEVLDVLLAIEYLKFTLGDAERPESDAPRFYDVTGDGVITSLDPLTIISYINGTELPEESDEPDEPDVIEENLFHNEESPTDVNGDGHLTPLDVLLLIDFVNKNGEETPISALEPFDPPIYYDTNDDRVISLPDTLKVIDAINESQQSAT